ncbi:ninjurin-2-like isoform X1 [Hyposmocoma kahamanoa]|uniref:ninjurin-2-like isoform X1 n=1 Tax=Hyposmocoma kahamanoa TaxID=1477025 RepID=UPI000E6D9C8E|nr:ninjurin-2-like isoform X1 [Hyposmocoma kahamanoa]
MADENKDAASATSGSSEETRQVNIDEIISKMQDAPTEVICDIKGLDANRYATKKTVAQGMLDIALLTSNASQLKYVLQVGPKHEFYMLLVVLISISIVLQLLVGLMFVIIGGLDLNDDDDRPSAVVLNDVIVIFIFVISVINMVISAFGIEYSNNPLVLDRLNYINSEYLKKGNATVQ